MNESNQKNVDMGLLILRTGIGIMFILHGYPKLLGGPELWGKIGSAMGTIGINFFPQVWGLCASLAEFAGGILIIAGFLFRPACILMAFTMFIAMMSHLGRGDGIPGASHAIESGILFISLIFIGPGNYAINKKYKFKKSWLN